MKFFKCSIGLLLSSLFFMQCSSIPKLEKEAPTEFEAVYYEKWNAGIKEGGSGTNVYIEVKDASVDLDSIYFRGHVTKLTRNSKNTSLFIGRFKSKVNDVMDAPKQAVSELFQLENNECVISYLIDQKTLYFKLSNLIERETINYPSSPQNGL